MAGCIGTFGYHVGAGATWDLDFDAFTGCDLKPYRAEKPGRRRVHAAAELSRTRLPEGLPSAAWEVTGEGAPPNVTLTGPGGESVTVTREAPVVENDRFYAQLREDGTAFVLTNEPAAGVWTLSDDGTVPVTRVREARGLPAASATASVSGRGRSARAELEAALDPGPAGPVRRGRHGCAQRDRHDQLEARVRALPPRGGAGGQAADCRAGGAGRPPAHDADGRLLPRAGTARAGTGRGG